MNDLAVEPPHSGPAWPPGALACGASVRWALLLDLATAIGVLQNAVEKADFRPVSVGADGVVIYVPRSLRKRRRAATLTAAVTDRGRRTEVCWLVAGPDDTRHGYLGLLEGHLPDGSLFDHRIREAAVNAGIASLDQNDIRSLAAGLQGTEFVRAIGTGLFRGVCGIVVLTDRRLLFHGQRAAGRALIDCPLGSIGSLTLGKKTTGETLTAVLPGARAVITNLGHGEGHGIARTFRETRDSLRPPEA